MNKDFNLVQILIHLKVDLNFDQPLKKNTPNTFHSLTHHPNSHSKHSLNKNSHQKKNFSPLSFALYTNSHNCTFLFQFFEIDFFFEEKNKIDFLIENFFFLFTCLKVTVKIFYSSTINSSK